MSRVFSRKNSVYDTKAILALLKAGRTDKEVVAELNLPDHAKGMVAVGRLRRLKLGIWKGWSPAQMVALKTMFGKRPWDEIALAVGKGVSACMRKAARMKLGRTRKQWYADCGARDNKILSMALDGKTKFRVVAHFCNTTEHTVKRVVRKHRKSLETQPREI